MEKGKLAKKDVASFRRKIWRYYKQHGRTLPWRSYGLGQRRDGTLDPYRVVVSEIMLQQTPVDRVIPKYAAFLEKFPSIEKLAHAQLRDVLFAWQGLGYNRRAKSFKKLAEIVVREHGGMIPRSFAALKALPGVGEYTARAVRTFAFNEPEVFIETNIRTVFIHSFFQGKKVVSDSDIFFYIAQTLPIKNPCEWYYALMDYGVMLKRRYPNPNRKSAHYNKQTKFAGSNRQIRGLIIKTVLTEGAINAPNLAQKIKKPIKTVRAIADIFVREGLLKTTNKKYIC